MKIAIVAILLLVVPSVVIVPVYAQTCFELANCELQTKTDEKGNVWIDVIGFFTAPLEMAFGQWIFVVVWGMIIIFIWIRTGNALYAGFIGIIISSSLTAGSSVLESLAPAMQMATILLACSFGLVLYAVYRRAETT